MGYVRKTGKFSDYLRKQSRRCDMIGALARSFNESNDNAVDALAEAIIEFLADEDLIMDPGDRFDSKRSKRPNGGF